MDRETTTAFLEALGVSNISTGGGWVRGSCPLAPWSHQKGTDSRPSFGVRITPPEEEGTWHCFSCNAGGKVGQLLNSLTWAQGEPPPKEAKAIYFAADLLVQEEPVFRGISPIRDRFGGIEVQSIAPKPVVPETVLRQYPPLSLKVSKGSEVAYKWLTEKRRIDPSLVESYGLRFQKDPLGIVFPICNRAGEVIDLWVRLLLTKDFYRLTPRITGSKIAYRAMEEWFGWQFYTPGKTLTVVEGAIDCLRLRSLGTNNVLASMGPPTTSKWSAIYSPLVVLGFDSDDTGRRYNRYAKHHLKQCNVWELDWGVAQRKDPGELKSKGELIKVLAKKAEYINGRRIQWQKSEFRGKMQVKKRRRGSGVG